MIFQSNQIRTYKQSLEKWDKIPPQVYVPIEHCEECEDEGLVRVSTATVSCKKLNFYPADLPSVATPMLYVFTDAWTAKWASRACFNMLK